MPKKSAQAEANEDSEGMDPQTYKEERKLLIDAELMQSRNYDKYLLLLSGGALALSVTFVGQMVPGAPCWTYILLGVSWICFTCSIGAGLSSILCSQKAFRTRLELLDAAHTDGKYPPRKPTPWDKRVGRLNVASMLSFLFGSVFLLVFAGLSIAYR